MPCSRSRMATSCGCAAALAASSETSVPPSMPAWMRGTAPVSLASASSRMAVPAPDVGLDHPLVGQCVGRPAFGNLLAVAEHGHLVADRRHHIHLMLDQD